MNKIKAIGEHVIAKEIKEEKTESGLIIPEGVKTTPNIICEVVSIGATVYLDNAFLDNTDELNKQKPDILIVGDIILCHPHSGQTIMVEGTTYRVFKQGEIYGRLNRKDEE